MGIFANIRDFLFSTDKRSQKQIEAYIASVGSKIQVKEYALQIAIDKISNALSLASFETYNESKPTRDTMWWRFNYEPNQNQTQNQFLHDVITQMIKNSDGALVVQTDSGEFVVAKNYTLKRFALKPNLYTNVVLPGEYNDKRTYNESEVLHFTLNDAKIKAWLDALYDDYGDLIAGSIRNYNRGNALKLGLKIGTMFDQQFGNKQTDNGENMADAILDEMYEKRFGAILSDKDSITPIEEGLDIYTISNTVGNTSSGGITTRDIAETIADVINYTADAFHIPRGIMKGDVADVEAVRDSFVNFGVRPFADVIETEINRKLYGQKRVAVGSKFKIQTNTIMIYDLVKFASSDEALFRIGVYNRDELRLKLGEEEINDETSKEYAVTKNYEFTTDLKGGEQDDTSGNDAGKQN